MALKQVSRPESLTELAYSELRAAILEDRISAGQTISVVSMADELGMSRSPVRAAVERLVSENLMRVVKGGFSVTMLERAQLLDALAVRAVLEGLAARLAAPQLSPVDIEALRQRHARFEAAIVSEDDVAARKADLEFHQAIHAHCANEQLIDHLARVQAQVVLATYSFAWTGQIQAALPEHLIIFEALERHDAPRAGEAAGQHLENLSERLRRKWKWDLGRGEASPASRSDNAHVALTAGAGKGGDGTGTGD